MARIEGEANRFEQLWTRRIEDNIFEICCIPFFLYGVALGDYVTTNSEYRMERVIRRSGRRTFRAWFGNSENPSREEVAREMEALGLLIEWSSRNLLAVDAEDELQANAAVELLSRRQELGELIFEDAG